MAVERHHSDNLGATVAQNNRVAAKAVVQIESSGALVLPVPNGNCCPQGAERQHGQEWQQGNPGKFPFGRNVYGRDD